MKVTIKIKWKRIIELNLILIILRITKIIRWNWIYIFSPTLILFAFLLTVIIYMLIFNNINSKGE